MPPSVFEIPRSSQRRRVGRKNGCLHQLQIPARGALILAWIGLLLQPVLAIDGLPVSVGATASAELLPTKNRRQQNAHFPSGDGAVADFPWQWRDEVVPSIFELPDPLAGLNPAPSPFLKVLAGEEDDAEGPAEPAAEDVEQDLAGDASPDAEVGIEPPADGEESWTPPEPAPDASGPGGPAEPADSGEPRDLLPVERQEGNCVITGEVSDVTTLDPIAGASVVVLGQGREDITDAQGRFRIGGLPPGDYTVEALKLEYSMSTVPASPRPGAPAEVRIALRKKPAVDTNEGEYLLAEESIVGEYNDTDQAALFGTLDIGKAEIGGSIDKSVFSKTAVSDAGDAVSKISGANIVGGRYAVVRGLGDRYVNTVLNGMLVPSADPSKKAVQLDLFPADLLQSVGIRKVFTPDLTSEFVGGLVQLDTVRIPEEDYVEVEYGVGSNTNLDPGETFFGISGRELNFWADNKDTYLDDPAVSNPFPQGVIRRPGNTLRPGYAAALDARRQVVLNTPFAPVTRDNEEDLSYAVSFGGSHTLSDSLKLGIVANFTHGRQRRYEALEVGRVGQHTTFPEVADAALPGRFQTTFVDPLTGFPTGLAAIAARDEDRYTDEVQWGTLLSGTISAADRHSITGTYFKNRTATDTVKLTDNLIQDFGSGSTATIDQVITGVPRVDEIVLNGQQVSGEVFQKVDSFETVYRDLELWQIDGRYDTRDPGERGVSLRLASSRATAEETRPRDVNLRIFRVTGDSFPDTLTPYNYFAPQNPEDSFVLSTGTRDISTQVRADLAISLIEDTREEDASKFDILLGGTSFDRTRESRGSRYTITQGIFFLGSNRELNNGADAAENLLNNQAPVDGFVEGNSFGWVVNDPTGNVTLNVDGLTENRSLYAMLDTAWRGWDVRGGVRAERETRSYIALSGPNAGQGTSAESDDVFPALFISKRFGRDNRWKVDLGWSETVARPIFYEFAEVNTFDQANNETFQGFPGLRDTFSTNTDIRVGWDNQEGDSAAVSLFHKDLVDPIVQIQTDFVTWRNFPSATVSGLEFDFSKQLADRWSIFGNCAYLVSDVARGEFPRNPGSPVIDTFEVDSLEGQPDMLANLILAYDNPDTGWAASLIYNFTGEYLVRALRQDNNTLQTPTAPNVVRQPFHQLDAVLSKTWQHPNTEIKLSFRIRNLLGSEERFVYGDSGLLPFQAFNPGRSYQIGLKATF